MAYLMILLIRTKEKFHLLNTGRPKLILTRTFLGLCQILIPCCGGKFMKLNCLDQVLFFIVFFSSVFFTYTPLMVFPLLSNNYFHVLTRIAKLAKGYLAIPASQASCERLFSITKNDITENRTSLKPDIVESLLFVGKKREIIKLLSNS